EKTFGKTIGGDLVEGKKTFPLLEALRRARGKEKALLKTVISNGGVARSKIARIRNIFEDTGAIEATRDRIRTDIGEAKNQIDRLPPSRARAMLHWLTEMLLHRTF
ncbi:MAG: polyprenyl synthetase family protein, partial [Bacteroidota bacterium]